MMFDKHSRREFRSAAGAFPMLPRAFGTVSSKPSVNPLCMTSDNAYLIESGMVASNGFTLSSWFVEMKQRNRETRRRETADFYANMWRCIMPQTPVT